MGGRGVFVSTFSIGKSKSILLCCSKTVSAPVIGSDEAVTTVVRIKSKAVQRKNRIRVDIAVVM